MNTRKLATIATLTLAPLTLTGCGVDATATIGADGQTTITADIGPLDAAHTATCDTYARLLKPTTDKTQQVTVTLKKQTCHIETTSKNLTHLNEDGTTLTIDPPLRITKEDFDKIFTKDDDITLTVNAPAPIQTAEGAEKIGGASAIYTNPNILTQPLTLTLAPTTTTTSTFPTWGLFLIGAAIIILAFEAFTRLKPIIMNIINKTPKTPTYNPEPTTTTYEPPASLPDTPSINEQTTTSDFVPSADTTRIEKDDTYSDDFWA